MNTIFDRSGATRAQAQTATNSGPRSHHSWLAVLAGCLLLPLAVISCTKHGPAAKPADVEYYTCTMHPSVKSQDPNAKCPICSMSLVPVKKKGAPAAHDHDQMKQDAGSMGMSLEEHAKMSGEKGKQEMKGME